MNPDYERKPCECSYYDASDCRLYFERRGTEHTHKVVLIMGAFATLRHFDELADMLASSGFNVLAYDHRGIGKSTVRNKKLRQTSTMLAKDCIELINHVFGSAQIHVYGASMGGCVAQHVALLLNSCNRLASLYLAVTSRGSFVRIFLPQFLWRFTIQRFIIKSESEKMIDQLITKCFDEDFLRTEDSLGKTMKERWAEKWTREYSEWFSFADVEITASQCSVFATHYLTERELSALRGLPITVHIADKDELMPPPKQRELGRVLQAHTVAFAGGHMSGNADKLRFYDELLRHLHGASRGVV